MPKQPGIVLLTEYPADSIFNSNPVRSVARRMSGGQKRHDCKRSCRRRFAIIRAPCSGSLLFRGQKLQGSNDGLIGLSRPPRGLCEYLRTRRAR